MENRYYQKQVINIPADSVHISIMHLGVEDQYIKYLCDPSNLEQVHKKAINFLQTELANFNLNLPIQITRKLGEVFNNAYDAFSKDVSGNSLQIQVVVKTHKDNLIIKIMDNGIGFNNQPKQKTFKLKDISPIAKENGKHLGGAGIGLKNLNYQVEQMGGTLFFKNKKQTGSSVYLSFPLASKLIQKNSMG